MRFVVPLLLLCAACSADAPPQAAQLEPAASPQQPTPEQPEQTSAAAAAAAPRSEIALPALDPDQEVSFDSNGRRRIGVHRDLPAPPAPTVAWTTDDQGEPLWRVEIRSPGAVALRFHFVDFELRSGFVTIQEAAEELRPAAGRRYEGSGPAGAGEFWSDIVEGEAAIVEYRPAAGDDAGSDPPFRIDKVSHLWQSPLDAF